MRAVVIPGLIFERRCFEIVAAFKMSLRFYSFATFAVMIESQAWICKRYRRNVPEKHSVQLASTNSFAIASFCCSWPHAEVSLPMFRFCSRENGDALFEGAGTWSLRDNLREYMHA